MNLRFLAMAIGEPIISHTAIGGGDIGSAFKVATNSKNYFVKSASYPQARAMLEAEAAGLMQLRGTNTIGIPEVLGVYFEAPVAYLVLEFLETKRPGQRDMEQLGRQLANLHQCVAEQHFGLASDNFIGSLAQSNTINASWTNFYVQERLIPQFIRAVDSGLLRKENVLSSNRMEQRCSAFFGTIVPSLLHGDLWSGNYLISTAGDPYLIDPAIYWGHNEVDIAMTKLFGGFSASFYGAYHEVLPAHPEQQVLTDVYQLYYLLVHLNLFGSSYLPAVEQLVRKYFS